MSPIAAGANIGPTEWELRVNSKAKMLHWLSPRLKAARVPPSLSFKVTDWQQDAVVIENLVASRFFRGSLAVRSSAAGEDGATRSAAGLFASVLSVDASDRFAVHAAVACVVDSYKCDGRKRHPNDEILVQEMVSESVMSGVVFTHDLDTGAPYLVVNYDDVSGRTDTVTSGNGSESNRTLYVHRGSRSQVRSPRFASLLAAIEEVEALVGSEFLDIEFAMGADLVPQLLQVRQITTQPNWNRATARRIDKTLEGVRRFVQSRIGPLPGVFGSTTVFGQMPDWNPAEMVGRAPRALALSLYTVLITDDAWRVARERMCYAVPQGQRLMVSLAGQPFIDTRLSFHSFLPSTVDADVGGPLVDAWVAKLASQPELHDKIEFDIAVTAYRFDLPDRIGELCGGALTADQQASFTAAVQMHTFMLVSTEEEGSLAVAESEIAELQRRQTKLSEPSSHNAHHALLAMMEDVVRYGTIPFAVLARHAFVAKSLLDSLVYVGAISDERLAAWYGSVDTVAGELVDAIHALEAGSLSRTQFLSDYGFLRPGTYDILSPRYDQMRFFTEPAVRENRTNDFVTPASETPIRLSEATENPFGEYFSADERAAVNAVLTHHGFGDVGVDGLFAYARRAIAGREYAKFVFTRTVSDLLEVVAAFGECNHLSRHELSHLRITDVLEMITSSQTLDIEDELRSRSARGVADHEVTAAIRLPQVLHDTAGVHIVPFQTAIPNFITSLRVMAPLLLLGDGGPTTNIEPEQLAGKVVLIAGADPGYDWIFAYQIAGLVTKFGGANSHMAIRCAEFGLPAAIGCGEQIYESLLSVPTVSLDCAARVVLPLAAGLDEFSPQDG